MTKANTANVRDRLAQRAGQSSNKPAQTRDGEAPSFGKVLKSYMNSDAIKSRFEEVLKNRAPQFMSSIINLVNSDANLQKCEPMSIISSCMVAATLDLPIDKNLGYAWIVPYKNRATFQMGYKGYIQLALRTGKYHKINAIPVCHGEFQSWNPLTEELVIDFTKRKSDRVIGYAGYFELVNGFRKTVYWTTEQIEYHRQKFSKSDYGWGNDYDAMGLKTVIRNMLSKWGILSIEMQEAYSKDVSEPTEDGVGPIIDIAPVGESGDSEQTENEPHDTSAGTEKIGAEVAVEDGPGVILDPDEDPFAE